MRFKLNFLILLFILLNGCATNSDENTPIPNPPQNLIGNVYSSKNINLEWNINSTDENQFTIERKIATGNYVVISTNATVTNPDLGKAWYQDIDLTPNTYTYRVKAVNSSGNSSEYSNELTLTILPPPIVTDVDGNVYYYKDICNKIWTTSNLNVSHYRNGDPIPQVTSNQEWASLTTGAWCYYNNDPTTESTYGRLYNWYAVTDPRGLAPVGYHIPTSFEFNELKSCAGNNGGGKLKEAGTSHWTSPNLALNTGCMTCTTPANNSLGFSALPGASRNADGIWLVWSNCCDLGKQAVFWSSSDCVYMSLRNNDPSIYIGNGAKNMGASVRCVKD